VAADRGGRDDEEENIVNLLRRLFASNDRFERYYGDVVRSGAGYPTADEARRDLIRYHQTMGRQAWVR
jgi:hypothetical protein